MLDRRACHNGRMVQWAPSNQPQNEIETRTLCTVHHQPPPSPIPFNNIIKIKKRNRQPHIIIIVIRLMVLLDHFFCTGLSVEELWVKIWKKMMMINIIVWICFGRGHLDLDLTRFSFFFFFSPASYVKKQIKNKFAIIFYDSIMQ